MKMLLWFKLFFLLLFSGPSLSFYGKYAQEADLSFHGKINVAFEGPLNKADLEEDEDLKEELIEEIKKQGNHLLGTFSSESFLDQFGYPGVLGDKIKIKIKKISSLKKGRKMIYYSFKSNAVFHTDSFGNKKTIEVPLKLPLALDRIYDLGIVGEKNRCTDKKYNSETDFFYFWDPDKRRCPLRGNKRDVIRIKGKLTKKKRTRKTFPEYDRLYGDNGNGKKLELDIFFGYIDDVKNFRKPKMKDEGIKSAYFFEDKLKKMKFKLVKEKKAFSYDERDGEIREGEGINFLRIYGKTVRVGRRKINVIVRVHITDTDINSKDRYFEDAWIEALENSDIIEYEGHSGLGENLKLSNFYREVEFNPKKYQIIFINGCSSYPYFRGMYVDAKGGTKNLDLILSGLSTYAHDGGPNSVAFVTSFLKGRKSSFQTILDRIEDSSDIDSGTYLTGVVGDDDNRWKKRSWYRRKWYLRKFKNKKKNTLKKIAGN